MGNFQKFLVPFDGSAVSERVTAKAAELAVQTGASIDFIYVAELRNGIMPQYIMRKKDMPADVVEALQKTGNEILQRAYNKLPQQLQQRTALHTDAGDPREIIVKFAKQLEPDLIFMGKRKYNSERDIITTSVGYYVIEAAECPVILVK